MVGSTFLLNRCPTLRLATWTINFSGQKKASLCKPSRFSVWRTNWSLNVSANTFYTNKIDVQHNNTIKSVQNFTAVLSRCSPDEEGSCCWWGMRGGCTGYGYWDSWVVGAFHSAGRQRGGGTAAAAGGVCHGGDGRLQGCDITFCIPHQTTGLLTHGYRDKTTTQAHAGPVHLHSTPFAPPSALLCHRWMGSCCELYGLEAVSSIRSRGIPTEQQGCCTIHWFWHCSQGCSGCNIL